ncbi:Hypothetical predicted protein [Pelobates cultripes]|uniref:Uncharacterized protein n=1 Tax=Pelobates cultripes TaxID=61616 RepID=A0AAD1WGR0_PELCU|nr:Hypothetical predicted protein [Pelobates cultripes]
MDQVQRCLFSHVPVRALACARPSCCGDVIRCTMGKVVCLESDAQAITHSCI